jgi:hypothetical protein
MFIRILKDCNFAFKKKQTHMRSLFLTFCFCSVMTFLWSQDGDKKAVGVHLNGNFQMGIPIDEFSNNLNDVGFGGGGLIVFKIGETPVYAGIELSGMIFDAETIDYTVNIGGFFEDYELKTNNSIFLGHAVFRFAPTITFPIRPYIDGMVGFKNLYTRTKLINLDDLDQDNNEDSRIDSGDWAFSYGGAIGFQFNIFGNPAITLDLRCAYLPGTNASYLVRKAGSDNEVFDEPIDAFEEKSSITTLLMPQLGITFNLGPLSDKGEEGGYTY